jgi:hypothetical protein
MLDLSHRLGVSYFPMLQHFELLFSCSFAEAGMYSLVCSLQSHMSNPAN